MNILLSWTAYENKYTKTLFLAVQFLRQPRSWLISGEGDSKCNHSSAPRLGVWLLTLHQRLPNLLKAVKERGRGETRHCRISSLLEHLAEHPVSTGIQLLLQNSNFQKEYSQYYTSACSLHEALDKMPEIWGCHNSFGSTILSDHHRSAHVGMPRCKTHWDSAAKGRQTGSIPSTRSRNVSRNDPKTTPKPHFHFISEKISLFTPKKQPRGEITQIQYG